MLARDISAIAYKIQTICYEVDSTIAGLSDGNSLWWARANSMRHAQTIRQIVNFVESRNVVEVNILNASGLGAGHQDFAILTYLKNIPGLKVTWTAIESPNSIYLEKTMFKNYIEKLGIHLVLVDFTNTNKLFFNTLEDEKYDIIIYTEIAEHLDHSVFIHSLQNLRNKLHDQGILIITTPNLVSFSNRARILLGNGDGSYWGDGILNQQAGLYGHISLYDGRRLTRLLKDSGYEVVTSFTFSPGHGPSEQFILKRIIYRVMDFISLIVKDSGSYLFLCARKSNPVLIPFKI